jgi:hypothetical protein
VFFHAGVEEQSDGKHGRWWSIEVEPRLCMHTVHSDICIYASSAKQSCFMKRTYFLLEEFCLPAEFRTNEHPFRIWRVGYLVLLLDHVASLFRGPNGYLLR